jgi:hypothetical protein
VSRSGPGRQALGLAAGLFIAGLAACASQPPDGPTGGEALEHRAGTRERHFARASLFISPSGQPFRAGPGEPYPVARWFAQADRNGDGRIDRAEFRADAEAFFKLLDKNHDGIIDGFEVSDYEQETVPEILGAYRAQTGSAEPGQGHEHEGRRGHRGAGGGLRADDDSAGGAEVLGGASPYELLPDPEPVASADRSLTGRISLADFLAVADRNFDRLDTKQLGYLTLAALPKTPVQQPAHRRR